MNVKRWMSATEGKRGQALTPGYSLWKLCMNTRNLDLNQTCLPLQFFMCTLAVKNVYNHKNHVYNQHREKTEMLITQRNKTKSPTENVAYTNAILVFTHHFLDFFSPLYFWLWEYALFRSFSASTFMFCTVCALVFFSTSRLSSVSFDKALRWGVLFFLTGEHSLTVLVLIIQAH